MNWKKVRDQKIISEHGVEYFDAVKSSYVVITGTKSSPCVYQGQKVLNIQQRKPRRINKIKLDEITNILLDRLKGYSVRKRCQKIGDKFSEYNFNRLLLMKKNDRSRLEGIIFSIFESDKKIALTYGDLWTLIVE